ncbi:MAG: family transporter solute-binding subunit [Geminicoccaceae bacterium]|jgi:TRAP transporter TAXI family solute receptor|nr:family transporter solute-binding subunit [Geminicoccaceae bacterium]MCE3247587.1 family transporter solute-binding subunit [Geminicoccaceae bacterium]MDF2782396.1 family transporter solute-binding subunit [Geminicoccaceae bacterium]
MQRFSSSSSRLAAAALLLAVGASSGEAQDTRQYILATATTGGTYYPVGVALATLAKVKLEATDNLSMSAISSAGSGENVKLLRENQAQFAILQALFGAWAAEGTGMLEAEGPQPHLRSISMLWQNVEHFVVTNDMVDSGTIEDLKEFNGAPFSIGARNSGTEGSGRTILQGLGIDPDQEFEIAYMGYTPTAEALQNGTIKGANLPGGVPVSAVAQAFAAMSGDLAILSFTEEQIAAANSEFDVWPPYEIPAGTYPGQDEPVTTVAQPNFLAVREDIPADDVYLITKTVYENLPFLQNIHAATKDMALEKAIAGLPVPLHPGAARYYEEQGIAIPDRLKPPA